MADIPTPAEVALAAALHAIRGVTFSGDTDLDAAGAILYILRRAGWELVAVGQAAKRCRCASEAGDTGDCPAHPSCDECGELQPERSARSCAEHAPPQAAGEAHS